MRENSQDWSVSVLAQAAGLAALNETAYVRETRELIGKERAYLSTQLRRTGFKVYPGRANFLLCRRQDKTNWVNALRKQGFLISDCSNFQKRDRHSKRKRFNNLSYGNCGKFGRCDGQAKDFSQ